MISLLLLVLSSALEAQENAEAAYDRSLTLTLSGSYVYKDDFGGLKAGYGAMIAYNYHLNDDYLLGINLLRYENHFGGFSDLTTYSYGFTFTHFWKKSWGDLGKWAPYMSYSILLNQGLQAGVSGRGLAHNTRMALGTEYALDLRQRLGWEGHWDYASYGFFGLTPLGYQDLGLGMNYRLLF